MCTCWYSSKPHDRHLFYGYSLRLAVTGPLRAQNKITSGIQTVELRLEPARTSSANLKNSSRALLARAFLGIVDRNTSLELMGYHIPLQLGMG